MKIDRHNYEEFFILYWDNELTAVQKQAVENFVNQNADLREEFEILGETRFTPDAVQFKEKDFLLNDSFINITNYEEQLLNYIDDEVTVEERKEVEKFVGQHPAAQKELTLFQKAKLQPEAEVIFPDRSVLYRREEKPVRVISMTWFRVAVAAAIILIAGFTVLQLVNTGKSGTTNPVVKTNPPVIDPSSNQAAITKDQVTKEPEQKTADIAKQAIKNQPKENIDVKNKVEENLIVNNTINQVENKNKLPKSRKDLTTNDQSVTQEVLANNNTPILKRERNAIQKTEPDTINDSFTKTDVTNKPELALYIPEQETKEKDGGGLKEFLRKTTRVFERRTKIQTTTEDNKLLVGAFAVSLK